MAQIQFKVGDKVRLIAMYPDGGNEAFDKGDLKLNEIYIITTDWGLDYNFPYTLGSGGWDVSADMIELIQEEKSEINTNTIQSLEAQIAELQQKLEEEKKKAAEKMNPWKLTKERIGFYAHIARSRVMKDSPVFGESDISTFATKAAAEGFLNVWYVMVMLRQQEGAGKKEEGKTYGWALDVERKDIYAFSSPELFSLFPPFPSRGLAQAALEAVGKERIIAAYKFLATGEST